MAKQLKVGRPLKDLQEKKSTVIFYVQNRNIVEFREKATTVLDRIEKRNKKIFAK